MLSRAHDVTLVGRRHTVDAVNSRGLRIEGITDLTAHPKAATVVHPDMNPDVLLVAVKAFDTQRAVEDLKPFYNSATFLSLQNGLGNAELIGTKAKRVVAGTTLHGVTRIAPGRLLHAGTGTTILGPFTGVGMEYVRELAREFSSAGLDMSTTERIGEELWRKALLNSAINPICALIRRTNGALLEDRRLEALAKEVLREGWSVARAAGFDFDEEALEELWRSVVTATAANRNSMLQDLETRRPTEVWSITGRIVEEGAKHGIPTPVNSTLLRLVAAFPTEKSTGSL